MNIEGVIIFDAATGIPLFSKLKERIDPSLFSSFIAAIGHFSAQLDIGGLSSFSTEEKTIFLASRNKMITALVTPKRPEFQQASSLASELARQFDIIHEAASSPQDNAYNEFGFVVDDFMKRVKNPFTSRVSSFIHAQYGGELQIKPRLMRESGTEGVIDILVDKGYATEANGTGSKSKQAMTLFSQNFIFCKLAEGRIGRGELMDFVDSVDGFGVRVMRGDDLEFIPYFPSRAAIVAREFSPQVFEFLKKMPRTKGDIYIDGAHVFLGKKLKGVPKETKCFVDLWKWHDDEQPEKVSI